jgi:hypothetical protein
MQLMTDDNALIISILHSFSRDSLFLSVCPLINFKKKMDQDAFFLNYELIPLVQVWERGKKGG